MTDPLSPLPPAPTGPRARQTETVALRQLSSELEAAFLSEMLAHAGLGKVSDSFGGGISEEQFSSFLRQEQADAMVRKGGIGLAESLFRAMTEGRNDH
jgi:Rod binding domain-containing protein